MSTLSDFFEKVANEIVEKKRNKSTEKDKFVTPKFNTSKCEDQFLGLMQIERGNARFCKWIHVAEHCNSLDERISINECLAAMNYPILIIVLESPHIDEFKCSPPIPAFGDTGRNLIALLPKYINRIDCTEESSFASRGRGYLDIADGIYRVKLVNAIQFQCSLGEGTEKYRDQVFDVLWENISFQKDFEMRISAPGVKIIINSSTESVRHKVQQSIDSIQRIDILKFHSYHPSNWKHCLGIEAEGW